VAGLFDPDEIQVAVIGDEQSVRSLPKDGRSGDPSVIRENLFKVNNSKVFKDLKLTTTNTRRGSPYAGPTESDVEAAIKLHCGKAEILAHLVEHLEARIK
jgi:hypothetical protein